MAALRRPLQGVSNILRFNWHFYVLAAIGFVALGVASAKVEGAPRLMALASMAILGGTILVSLLVSCYVYDFSGLYGLRWLDGVTICPSAGGVGARMASIHAGFDETSGLLRARYPEAEWTVMDFYDPARHTEVSIRRARRAYPPSPADVRVDTSKLPVPSSSLDAMFIILAAHEIRDADERHAFFAEVHRVLKTGGRVIVVEHLRDWRNFLAYSVGFLHFIDLRAWLEAFEQAGLGVYETIAPNPFMTCFVLEKSGDTR